MGFIIGKCKGDQAVHTKVGQCSLFEGKPLGFIIHHDSTSFSIDETEFNAEIKAGVYASGINRITPLLGGVTDYQPTGGDVMTNQEGFGPEVPVGLNPKRVDYIINKGGLCLLRQLKKLNGRQVRIFLVDMATVAYGTSVVINGEEKFRGFSATIWVAKRDNTGSAGGAIILSVFFSADYENEENNLASIGLTETIEGLTGVVLMKTGTGNAKFVIACSADDLTTTFKGDLADVTLYKSDAGVTPTAVVYNSTTEDLTFTPVGKYRIEYADVLTAAGIEGMEGEDEYTDLS